MMLLPPIRTFTAPPEQAPALGDDELHLWLHVIDGHPTPRDVASGAQALLSRHLMHYAGTDRAPDIARGEHGKPHAPALAGLDFNLSHARHHVLLAFARNQPVGVDLERLDRTLAVDELSQRFFAPAEAEALAALESSRRLSSFLHLWTCKEAVLKAIGAGLSFGLGRVAFGLSADGLPERIAHLAPDAGRAADWCVVPLEPAPGLTGALAWHGPPRTVRAFCATPDA